MGNIFKIEIKCYIYHHKLITPNSFNMKYLLLIFAGMLSCKSTDARAPISKTELTKVNPEDGFRQLASKEGSYILYYKVDAPENNPVRQYTYYIISTETKKIVRSSQSVTAEKIYWKTDQILAIIPYTEVMKHSDNVNVNHNPKEILINLNK